MTYPAQADRILVMTTNAIGQLARAPLRSGRVNLKVRCGHADFA